MKALRIVMGAWILTALASYPGAAQSREFGIGIVIGEPTGFSAKTWTSPGNAVEMGVFGEDKARVGIRVPGGIAYWPRSIPLDVFLEIALIMDVAPATELSLNGGIGARYFFQ
jgi:hypothetical protein